jgi:hypothetical protein
MSYVDAAPTGGCGADHPYDGEGFWRDRNRKMVGGRRSNECCTDSPTKLNVTRCDNPF